MRAFYCLEKSNGRLSETSAGGRNALAFLDMLAWSEGTSTSPATAMDGYDVIVTGIDRKPEVFKDFTDHPFARGRASKVISFCGNNTEWM